MKLTFLIPLIAFALGIWISSEWIPGYGFPLIAIGGALFFWIYYRLLSRNPLKAYSMRNFHLTWIFCIFIAIGALDFEFNSRSEIPVNIENTNLVIKGEIYDTRALTSGDQFKIKIISLQDEDGKEIITRNARILVKTDGLCARNGDVIKFIGQLHRFHSDTETGRQYANTMHREGIDYYAATKSDRTEKQAHVNNFQNFFEDIREFFIILLEKSGLKKDTRNFIISILLGERSYLSQEIKETLSNAGLAHVLALSGLHIGILMAIFLGIFYPIALMGFPIWQKVLAILLVWIYVAVTGWTPSTVRAAIMATFVIGAYIFQRKNSSLNALLASALLILFADPKVLWNIGMQMSFISVLSILLFAERLNTIDRHHHPFIYKSVSLLLISLVATFSTWCLVAYYFKNIPLLFIPSNLLLLPLLPFFIYGSIIYIILLAIHIDAILLGEWLDFFQKWFVNIAAMVSNGSSSVVNVSISNYTVIFWLCGIIMIGTAFYVNSMRLRKIYSIMGTMCLIFSFLPICFDKDQYDYKIVFPHSFTDMKAYIKADDEFHKLSFERNSIAEAGFSNMSLLVIDCPLLQENLNNLINDECGKTRILYLGPGADFFQIARLSELIPFEKIILHSGIGNKMKEQLIKTIDMYPEDRIYSLRENGSLEFSL